MPILFAGLDSEVHRCARNRCLYTGHVLGLLESKAINCFCLYRFPGIAPDLAYDSSSSFVLDVCKSSCFEQCRLQWGLKCLILPSFPSSLPLSQPEYFQKAWFIAAHCKQAVRVYSEDELHETTLQWGAFCISNTIAPNAQLSLPEDLMEIFFFIPISYKYPCSYFSFRNPMLFQSGKTLPPRLSKCRVEKASKSSGSSADNKA